MYDCKSTALKEIDNYFLIPASNQNKTYSSLSYLLKQRNKIQALIVVESLIIFVSDKCCTVYLQFRYV